MNPYKYLDMKIIRKKGIATTEVDRKDQYHVSVQWTSRIPKRYKRYSVISDLIELCAI